MSDDEYLYDNRFPDSLVFRECCEKLRANDPTILPGLPDHPFIIRNDLSSTQRIELADALLESKGVKRLSLVVDHHYNFCDDNCEDNIDERSVEAMAKFLRSSQHLVSVTFEECLVNRYGGNLYSIADGHQSVMRGLLRALRGSTSLKELSMRYLILGCAGPELEKLLIETKSLLKLQLSRDYQVVSQSMVDVRAVLAGNSSLQALTLSDMPASNVPHMLQSLHSHPCLEKICFEGRVESLEGLDPLLQRNNTKITKLIIDRDWKEECNSELEPPAGLTPVLYEMGRKTDLSKLSISDCNLNCDQATQLRTVLRKNESLQSLALKGNILWSTHLVEIAPALYRHASIKELDLSWSLFEDMESAVLLRDIVRRNKTMTKLDLAGNDFGGRRDTLRCIADGLGSSASLLELDIGACKVDDRGLAILAQRLGARNRTLQKLVLFFNSITSVGVRALIDTMVEHDSIITDLDLGKNPIGGEGARFLDWSASFASTLPLLLGGFRENISLVHVTVHGCVPLVFPPTHAVTTRCAGGWVQEMKCLGYRNRFLSLIRLPLNDSPPPGLCSHALARVAALPDVLFLILCAKANLVPSVSGQDGGLPGPPVGDAGGGLVGPHVGGAAGGLIGPPGGDKVGGIVSPPDGDTFEGIVSPPDGDTFEGIVGPPIGGDKGGLSVSGSKNASMGTSSSGSGKTNKC
jgi:hypothetical protein